MSDIDTRIVLQDDLIINYAVDTKDIFMDALTVNKISEFDLSKVSAIDISGLQLLISLFKEADLLGKDVMFVGEADENFINDINRISFSPEPINNIFDLTNFIRSVV